VNSYDRGPGTISYEDATALADNISRVKRVMAKYAANLLIRRSQVQDHSGSSAAEAYLRDQLYAQSGQKLLVVSNTSLAMADIATCFM